MSRKTQLSFLRFALLVIAAMAIFALDVAMPVVVVQVLYIPLLILAAWYFSPRIAWTYFAFCATLAVYDLELDRELISGNVLWQRLANEVVLVGAGASLT